MLGTRVSVREVTHACTCIGLTAVRRMRPSSVPRRCLRSMPPYRFDVLARWGREAIQVSANSSTVVLSEGDT